MIKNECLIGSFHKYSIFRKMAIKEKIGHTNILPEQFPVLFFIKDHIEVTQKEIANGLKVTPASIALSTKRLEQSGYIIKIQSDENKRCNKISLTAKGKNIVKNAKKTIDEIDELTFKGVTREEKEIVKKVYDKIIYNISGMSNDKIDKEDIFSFKEKLKTRHSK